MYSLRYEVGCTCPDSNGQYVNIWDNVEGKNVTWAHRDSVYSEVRKLNEKKEV
jgi:hypothetical protein